MQGISRVDFISCNFTIFMISSSNFLVVLCRGSCHLQTVRVLLLFQFGFRLFLFLLWLLWPKLPELCWIVVVKVGTLVLFLTSGECFQFFTTEDNVCCGFVIYSFYYVDFAPSILAFLRVFIINGCWILSKAFSASTEIIMCLLFFNLLIWWITLTNLQILKNPCIPRIKPTWSWCMIFFSWILFVRILLRIFVSMFISDIDL